VSKYNFLFFESISFLNSDWEINDAKIMPGLLKLITKPYSIVTSAGYIKRRMYKIEIEKRKIRKIVDTPNFKF
jgi:hypothetical protein